MTDLNTAMETNLLDAGNVLSLSLKRAKEQLPAEQYAMLVEWMGYFRMVLGLAPTSGHNYTDSVSLFMQWLNDAGKTLEAVTAADVERWQQVLYLDKREGASTRNGRLVAVRQFFEWREKNGGGMNPARSVKGPKKTRRAPRKYSRDQLQSMFATLDREKPLGIRDYAVMMFFLGTGARRGEVAALDLEHLVLNQRGGMVRFMGKGSRERVLTFGKPVVDALQAWLAVRDGLEVVDREALFVGISHRTRGQRLSQSGLDGVINRAKRSAGLRLKDGNALHVLRSTFATQLYDETGDIERVRIALGHDDINTTRQYIAISNRQLNTRLSNDFMNDVTGGGSNGGKDDTPIWVQRFQQKHGRAA